MKMKIIVASILALAPAVALAGPSLGIGYTDVGIPGHAGRPGINIESGQEFRDGVVAWGGATLARSFYAVSAHVGKAVPMGRGLSLVPYAGAGFVSLNEVQQVTGSRAVTSTTPSMGFGRPVTYTYSVPYSLSVPTSRDDFYLGAGANLQWTLSPGVALVAGGDFGHTLGGIGGGGSVYGGHASLTAALSRQWSGNLRVSYLHLPGAQITEYGAGISYQFS